MVWLIQFSPGKTKFYGMFVHNVNRKLPGEWIRLPHPPSVQRETEKAHLASYKIVKI